MKSVMKHQFSQIPNVQIPRSRFDRSHGLKTSFDAGFLIPIFLDEVVPGDSFNLRLDAFARLATPIHPVMDNMYLETFFFFVPTRTIWTNFKKMMGEQDNPTDSIDYTLPRSSYQVTEGSLLDYLGLPPAVGTQDKITDLPMRAYVKIWNEWFRDQNLQDSLTYPTGNGVGTLSDYPLLRRGKRHDYFTSCLPWPQKGGAVNIPIAGEAPVMGIGNVWTDNGQSRTIQEANDSAISSGQLWNYSRLAYIDGPPVLSGASVYADLDQVTATINELRQAFQIQKLLEKDARGGSRYVEVIASHFGISNAGGDARLQRAEYLGGGSSPVNINPIAQTSETTGTTPQGNLSAMGTASVSGHGFSKSFTEHGYIIGLANVRADLTYQQGINRLWSRQTRYDFYWPSLAHIGEQAVLNKEIMAVGSTATDDLVFGYQERFAEYRYKPSMITGAFRSNAAQSLDTWHLSQDFATVPNLNASFIEDNPPIDRIIAVPSQPQFIMDCYFNLKCARPMPLYGVPGLIDHF